ncbi:putative ATP-dependent RNA helicase DHX36 [Monocercomonoides exilis]|uniref:putative ATP-dependent RNA helicase DHX36 n=1 Tax=Monocercomonoides exilis TaxID=2049356 RepID=UPI003559762F|nr:putative ATP-dependent RNA helicase DHX36 [Monocercomonoides exilis]
MQKAKKAASQPTAKKPSKKINFTSRGHAPKEKPKPPPKPKQEVKVREKPRWKKPEEIKGPQNEILIPAGEVRQKQPKSFRYRTEAGIKALQDKKAAEANSVSNSIKPKKRDVDYTLTLDNKQKALIDDYLTFLTSQSFVQTSQSSYDTSLPVSSIDFHISQTAANNFQYKHCSYVFEPQLTESEEETFMSLVEMYFHPAHALQAVRVMGGDQQLAMDWLLLNLDDDELPSTIHGDSQQNIYQYRLDSPIVKVFVKCGFARSHCLKALSEASSMASRTKQDRKQLEDVIDLVADSEKQKKKKGNKKKKKGEEEAGWNETQFVSNLFRLTFQFIRGWGNSDGEAQRANASASEEASSSEKGSSSTADVNDDEELDADEMTIIEQQIGDVEEHTENDLLDAIKDFDEKKVVEKSESEKKSESTPFSISSSSSSSSSSLENQITESDEYHTYLQSNPPDSRTPPPSPSANSPSPHSFSPPLTPSPPPQTGASSSYFSTVQDYEDVDNVTALEMIREENSDLAEELDTLLTIYDESQLHIYSSQHICLTTTFVAPFSTLSLQTSPYQSAITLDDEEYDCVIDIFFPTDRIGYPYSSSSSSSSSSSYTPPNTSSASAPLFLFRTLSEDPERRLSRKMQFLITALINRRASFEYEPPASSLSHTIDAHPILFEMLDWINENVPTIILNPPPITSTIPPSCFMSSTSPSSSTQSSSASASASSSSASMNTSLSNETVLPPHQAWGVQPSAARDAELKQKLEMKRKDPSYIRMVETQRGKLPVYQERYRILREMEAGKQRRKQVVVISSETGSGKTTQLPQILLDNEDENGRGSRTNIICLQPRRIAAMSIAERVSVERGERLGGTVGFRVRGVTEVSPNETRLTYCTTGVMLRYLMSHPMMEGISCLFVDEVHERTIETDFLLSILKTILPHRPDLFVVLMSATLNAELFSNYFGGAPIISVQGRQFPVERKWLLDAVMFARYQPNIEGKRLRTVEEAVEMCGVHDFSSVPQRSIEFLCRFSSAQTPLDLITAIISRIVENPTHDRPSASSSSSSFSYSSVRQSSPGAILVFLSGMDQIRQMELRLASSPSLASSLFVVPVHSSLSPAKQNMAFATPPRGKRKVVLATNIAETSLTIDDVVYVIDTGKEKEMTYDPAMKMSSLKEHQISKSNATQRAGRAGRVMPGVCFHLYTQKEWSWMRENPLPEMRRVSLEQLCLQVIGMKAEQQRILRRQRKGRRTGDELEEENGEDVMKALKRCIDPPKEEDVQSSLTNLANIGAIEPIVVKVKPQKPTPQVTHSQTSSDFSYSPSQSQFSYKPSSSSSSNSFSYSSASTSSQSSQASQSPFTSSSSISSSLSSSSSSSSSQTEPEYQTLYRLTPMGQLLSLLPMDAVIGKMLIYGVLLGCLQSALTVAACLVMKSPFLAGIEHREDVREARERFEVPFSDHLTLVKVFDSWMNAVKNGKSAEFCRLNSLSIQAMQNIAEQRREFHRNLIETGIIERKPREDERSNRGGGGQRGLFIPKQEEEFENRHNNNKIVVLSVIAAALFPNIIRVVNPSLKFTSSVYGALSSQADAKAVKFFISRIERVFLHPQSINFKHNYFPVPFLAYNELINTSKPFVVDSSIVPIFALLLFAVGQNGAGALRVSVTERIVQLGNGIFIGATGRVAVLMTLLHNSINSTLHSLFLSPASRSRGGRGALISSQSKDVHSPSYILDLVVNLLELDPTRPLLDLKPVSSSDLPNPFAKSTQKQGPMGHRIKDGIDETGEIADKYFVAPKFDEYNDLVVFKPRNRK